jgi:hypothetical protein
MPTMDFPTKTIKVRYNSEDYGPHNFDFEDAAPSGCTLSAVTLRAFKGRVTPDDDLSGETEETSNLVDALLTGVSGNYIVEAFFNYPGSTKTGNYTLIFEITWSNSADHPYYFYKVKVE